MPDKPSMYHIPAGSSPEEVYAMVDKMLADHPDAPKISITVWTPEMHRLIERI